MALLYIKRYTRAFIRAHPDWLFVFGDNFERKGLGGQAKEARGEPNAVGIITKRKPSNAPDAFLEDGDFSQWEAASFPDRERIELAIAQHRPVIWPLDGVGSGRAKLQEKAPEIADAIEKWRIHLEEWS